MQNVIAAASDGAVITFAAGNYSFTSAFFSLTKGATLICATAPLTVGAATVNPCTITASNTVFGSTLYAAGNTHFYRISGFTININSGGIIPIWFCSQGGCTGSFTQIRVDHNTLNFASAAGGTAGIIYGENSAVVTTAGVTDHNLFSSATSVLFIEELGKLNGSTANPPFGQSNNMFVENNTFTTTTLDNNGVGCVDGWSSAFAMVVRYNTITNCRILSHGVPHGGGPANFEVYGNSITMTSGAAGQGEAGCFRCVHHQGSNTMVAFSNTFTPAPATAHDSEPMAFLHYRDDGTGPSDSAGDVPPACDGTVANATWPTTSVTFSDGNRTGTFGYPCFRQPGRDITGAYKPMYFWNNQWTDDHTETIMQYDDPWSGIPPPGCTPGAAGNCDYSTLHIIQNREWFQAVSVSAQSGPTSPFNGTTGMGFGTLANRPTTCTTSTEAGAGVGYFATDQGSQGTLYTCSGTNTWTLYYVPFTYPHPLITGSTLAPPTNLKVTPLVKPLLGFFLH